MARLAAGDETEAGTGGVQVTRFVAQRASREHAQPLVLPQEAQRRRVDRRPPKDRALRRGKLADGLPAIGDSLESPVSGFLSLHAGRQRETAEDNQ